jgi:hypothetical protein
MRLAIGRLLLLAVIALAAVAASAHAAVATRSAASHRTIQTWMRKTVEVGDQRVHFRQVGHRVVVPDGHGGTLTAAIGVRAITADGHGPRVFFFHGRHFLGWDANREIASIRDIAAAGRRRFDVTYVRYAARDPLCCPSRSPKTVRYRWTGTRIKALARRPRDPGTQVHVRLRH